jgi:hypothetical protein
MDVRYFLSHPFSSIRQWALSHERFIAVNLTWALAVLFIIVSLVYLFKSLGIL